MEFLIITGLFYGIASFAGLFTGFIAADEDFMFPYPEYKCNPKYKKWFNLLAKVLTYMLVSVVFWIRVGESSRFKFNKLILNEKEDGC